MTLASAVLGDIRSAEEIRQLIPVGVILPYAGDPGSAPTGFVYARGQLVASATYPELDALIGGAAPVGAGRHAYNGGTDPGGGQLRVPDLRQASPLGGSAPGSGPAGAKIGSRNHAHGVGGLGLEGHQHAPGGSMVVATGHNHGHSLYMPDHSHGMVLTSKPVYHGSNSHIYINHYSQTVGSGAIGLGGGIYAQGAMGVQGATDWAAAGTTGQLASSEIPYLTINFLVRAG